MASEAFYAFVQVHAELNRHWASGDKMSESVELNYAHRLAHYSLKMTERELD